MYDESYEVILCSCCSLAVANDDRSGCEYGHATLVYGYPHVDHLLEFINPASDIIITNPVEWDENERIHCSGCGIELTEVTSPYDNVIGFRALVIY